MIDPSVALLAEIAAFIVFVGLLIGACIGLRRGKSARLAENEPEGTPYRVYADEFDLELYAYEVVHALPTASPDRDKGFQIKSDDAWHSAARRLDAMAESHRDAVRARLPEWRSAAEGVDPADIAVAILIDQSGSMKGDPIAAAAVTAQLIDEALGEFGASTEILGFSTAGWHGGKARVKWTRNGRPKRPGRLCALLHIVYKSAEEPALTADARAVIIHPDVLRENLDGEALLWAWERLSARPQPHKLLLMLSDGAPVDDSTLMQNGSHYLWRHLMAVLDELRDLPALVLGGVGIGHKVDRVYPIAGTAAEPSNLPAATADVIEQMLAEMNRRAGSPEAGPTSKKPD